MTEDEIELFDYKCPYTDKPCYNNWECKGCDVEAEELKWLNCNGAECDDDCEHCDWVTCPKEEEK